LVLLYFPNISGFPPYRLQDLLLFREIDDVMFEFMDNEEHIRTKEKPTAMIQLQEMCKTAMKDFLNIKSIRDNDSYNNFLNFIMNCLIYITDEPERFEDYYNEFIDELNGQMEKQAEKVFSIDLFDKADKDYQDLVRDDSDYSDDDLNFVVPDDYVEYEDGYTPSPVPLPPPKKKRNRRKTKGSGKIDGGGVYKCRGRW